MKNAVVMLSSALPVIVVVLLCGGVFFISSAQAEENPLEMFGADSEPATSAEKPTGTTPSSSGSSASAPSATTPSTIPVGRQQPLMIDRKGLAVKIDDEPISLDQVFEAWGPAWYEAVNAARGGRLPADQVDTRLQQEWDKALDAVIRDSVFYLEAQRYFEDMLQEQVGQRYTRQQAAPNDGSRPMSRQQVESVMRRERDEALRASCDEMINAKIRESGGAQGLKRILDARSMSWEEWRQRQIRKAYTYTYLHARFRPVEGVEYRPADVLKFYRENPELFTEPGEVVFRHILFSYDKHGGSKAAYDAAWGVYDKISQGALTFEDAAKSFSDDAVSAPRGGLETSRSSDDSREGWLSFVREAAREEKPAALGPILESAIGYHLVMLIKQEQGVLMPYLIAQRIIQDRMRSEEWDTKCDQLYENLKKRVRIEIKTPTFPPQLSWAVVSGSGGGVSVRRIGPASEDVP